MYICTPHASLVPTEDKEGIGFHGSGVTDVSHIWVLRTEPGPLDHVSSFRKKYF